MEPRQETFTLTVRAAARLAKVLGPRSKKHFGSRLRNPVFMVGCGRSGTSLLASILSAHPDIAVYPSEANDLWHPTLYPWHRSRSRVPPIWVDPHQFTNHSLKHIDWSHLRAVFGAFQSFTRRPVFLNKSVMLSFMLTDIIHHFDDARFIHMHRDGRAVALSYAKKNLPKIQQNPEVYASAGVSDDFHALVYRSFDHWVDHIDAVEKADQEAGLSKAGRLLEFSYEAFSQDPEQYLVTVLHFMGVKAETRDVTTHTVISNRNYKISNELSADIVEKLVARGGSTLERKGYATP
jgi:hypothetical protein